jgi:hypothetical protein
VEKVGIDKNRNCTARIDTRPNQYHDRTKVFIVREKKCSGNGQAHGCVSILAEFKSK